MRKTVIHFPRASKIGIGSSLCAQRNVKSSYLYRPGVKPELLTLQAMLQSRSTLRLAVSFAAFRSSGVFGSASLKVVQISSVVQEKWGIVMKKGMNVEMMKGYYGHAQKSETAMADRVRTPARLPSSGSLAVRASRVHSSLRHISNFTRKI